MKEGGMYPDNNPWGEYVENIKKNANSDYFRTFLSEIDGTSLHQQLGGYNFSDNTDVNFVLLDILKTLTPVPDKTKTITKGINEKINFLPTTLQKPQKLTHWITLPDTNQFKKTDLFTLPWLAPEEIIIYNYEFLHADERYTCQEFTYSMYQMTKNTHHTISFGQIIEMVCGTETIHTSASSNQANHIQGYNSTPQTFIYLSPTYVS